MTKTDFLCADIVDEFGGRFDADLGFNLLNKGIGVNLATIESLINLI
jgi:hypothetical protein